MRENVLGLRAVLADGTVIDTGTRARKSSAGYDLTRLLLGSEGTLAVITELTLRIHGIPEEIAAARCVFEDLAGAVATVTEAVQLGIPVARCELLDPAAIRAVNAHDDLSEPEAYTLFLEFHGGPASVGEQVESVREIAAGHGGGDFGWTKTTDERNKLWRARHNAYFAVVATRAGTRAQTTDVCVPVSRLAESITASAEDAAQLPFPAALVGHVADGNYHWICPVDTDSEAEQAALAGFVERMVTRAQEAGGTCTGEHGVGIGKREALLAQAGPEAVATMRALKQALDPRGILNPGKVLPDA
jgi:D-lactate dehydrogenase (cytochrome)